MSQVPIFLLLSLPLVGAFALFALGLVVIHRSSRVLNLAHGAMAMIPAYLAYELTQRGVPAIVAFPFGVVAGAALGVAVERAFVRTLRAQGATAQTVGTVAALGLLVGIAVKVWGTTPRIATGVFPDSAWNIGASKLRYGQVGLFVVALIVAAAAFAFFQRTEIGLAMRGVADNRRAASLMGVDPDRMAVLAWAIGGGLAAIAGILLAAVTVLHPVNLTLLVLPAFVAALIGGLESLPGALTGSAIVGVVQGMVPSIGLIPGIGSFATQVGATQVVLALLAFVVMTMRGQRYAGAPQAAPEQGQGPSIPDDTRPSDARLATARAAFPWVAAGFLLVWPFLGGSSLLGRAIEACLYVVIASSLVLLTGWVGQISLAQAAFVGIGAFTAAQLANRAGVQFPLNLPLAAGAAAAVAALLGMVALRVRGLYLAVATLIFLWVANEYLFRSSWLVGPGGSARIDSEGIGRPDAFPFFDLTERRTFYYVALAAAAATIGALVNLRRSKTGRAFFAVRGSESAAASLGIDVMRTKLLAFAISGFLAGTAGTLLITGAGSASASEFGFAKSMLYLSIAVIGGLQSLGGAVAASVLFAALGEFFFRLQSLAPWFDVLSAALLAAVLLAYPGGLAGLWSRRSRAATSSKRARSVEVVVPADPRPRGTRGVLDVEGLTVRFGGLVAVDGVTLSVREAEIVGLIGPNGAGKTTTFNAISGLIPASAGAVHLFGRDVTELPVHERAAMGVARTFQIVQLFRELTVFDNLLVATHLRDPTGAFSHLIVTRPALDREREARARVRDAIDRYGLGDIADRPVAGLPFGMLRTVELARAVVTGAPFLMLDEPASGLDDAETERLAERLRALRDEKGTSILLIEHDVQMVAGVSDTVYVIDRGAPLAAGPPASVLRDERVIGAYLGSAPASDGTMIPGGVSR